MMMMMIIHLPTRLGGKTSDREFYVQHSYKIAHVGTHCREKNAGNYSLLLVRLKMERVNS